MYDTFEPFIEFDPLEFQFQANTYEIWKNRALISKGNLNISVIAKDVIIQNANRTILVLNETLNGLLREGNVFDKVMSSNDRLVLLTLPENSPNSNINMLSQMYGTTRPPYLLSNNEAYSCSVFSKNKNIAKLSFNLFNGTLVELY